jgi:hypothetical protein
MINIENAVVLEKVERIINNCQINTGLLLKQLLTACDFSQCTKSEISLKVISNPPTIQLKSSTADF